MYPLPLHIECPYGLNQPYHPSVIYCETGLFGYSYWMAQTPYPIADREPYRDRYENPCIYYSDDGFNWTPIDNPLDDLTKEEIHQGCYFSDPHLVVKDLILELFYRFFDGHGTLIYKKFTMDGLHWSDRELVIDMRTELSHQLFGNDMISPAIIWSEEKGYECWYVDDTYLNLQRKIRYISSVDGIVWRKSQLCVCNGGETIPWHIDVQKIEEELNMIVFDVNNQWLDWYVEETKQTWKYLSRILVPSHRKGDFYECGLYRACVIKVKKIYRIYFSAHNDRDSSIGVIETSNRQHFTIRTGQSLRKTIKNSLYWYYKSVRRILKKCIEECGIKNIKI